MTPGGLVLRPADGTDKMTDALLDVVKSKYRIGKFALNSRFLATSVLWRVYRKSGQDLLQAVLDFARDVLQ